MTRIAVFSDCHRRTDALIASLQAETVDGLIGLGDFNDDGEKVAKACGLPILQVRGNGDWASQEPVYRLFTLGPLKIYACHGHVEGVKRGLLNLAYRAQEAGADLALFGHTHSYTDADSDGLRLLNPGSAGLPPYGQRASYMILEWQRTGLRVLRKDL